MSCNIQDFGQIRENLFRFASFYHEHTAFMSVFCSCVFIFYESFGVKIKEKKGTVLVLTFGKIQMVGCVDRNVLNEFNVNWTSSQLHLKSDWNLKFNYLWLERNFALVWKWTEIFKQLQMVKKQVQWKGWKPHYFILLISAVIFVTKAVKKGIWWFFFLLLIILDWNKKNPKKNKKHFLFSWWTFLDNFCITLAFLTPSKLF